MNTELALKICPEFRPVQLEDGRVKCRFYNDDGICKRPEYFRCELVLYREKEERLLISTPMISVSRTGTLLRCPRMYAFNYIFHTDPPLPAKWKVAGRAFSDARAKIDAGIPYELTGDINSYPIDRAKLRAVLARYGEWKKDFGDGMNEVRVFFPYKDVNFVGYIDRLTRNQKTIVEWKYAATQYDELKAIRQAAVYFKGIPEAEKFVLAVAKKPQQKLKGAGKPTKKEPNPQAETPADLEKRIYDELADKKDELFTYTSYDREFFDIDGTLEQLYQSSRLITAFEAADWPPALGANCDNCDYRPYCLKHLTNIGCDRKFCSHPLICDQIRRIKNLPAARQEKLLSK